MPDGISFTMITTDFTRFMDDRQVRMRQAAMFNVREAGRVCRAAAKAKAPVLKGAGAIRVTAWKKGGRTWSNAPVAGLLRSSIASSRGLKTSGDTWSVTVGPRGPRVRLYAKKEEIAAGFMEAGYQAAVSQYPAISQATYSRVWRE